MASYKCSVLFCCLEYNISFGGSLTAQTVQTLLTFSSVSENIRNARSQFVFKSDYTDSNLMLTYAVFTNFNRFTVNPFITVNVLALL